MSTIQPHSSIGEPPLKTGSSFSRPAAIIGGATALIALTAIATTLVVKSPQPEASVAGATVGAVAAQSLGTATNAKVESKAEGKGAAEAAPADKPAPVRAAKANAVPQASRQVAQAAPAPCATCGVIESVTPFEQKGEGSGVGAVGGAVVGGLLGHQVGGGNGKKAMTVLGAVGGGLAGNEIEKRQRATTMYSVKVRMDDGSHRTVTQSTAPTVGQKVTVEGSQIRAKA